MARQQKTAEQQQILPTTLGRYQDLLEVACKSVGRVKTDG